MRCLNEKTTQIIFAIIALEKKTLITHQKERIDWTKKVPLAEKKVRLGTRGFRAYFWEVDHPLWVV